MERRSGYHPPPPQSKGNRKQPEEMPWENTRVAQCALAHAKERLEPREPEGLGGIVPRLKKHHGLYGSLNFWIQIVRKRVCLLLRYQAHGHLLWNLWDADMLACYLTK